MNPIILRPAMGKQQDRLGSSALVRQLVQEKENSEFKPVQLRLKIDLVSYPARAEGSGKGEDVLQKRCNFCMYTTTLLEEEHLDRCSVQRLLLELFYKQYQQLKTFKYMSTGLKINSVKCRFHVCYIMFLIFKPMIMYLNFLSY